MFDGLKHSGSTPAHLQDEKNLLSSSEQRYHNSDSSVCSFFGAAMRPFQIAIHQRGDRVDPNHFRQEGDLHVNMIIADLERTSLNC